MKTFVLFFLLTVVFVFGVKTPPPTPPRRRYGYGGTPSNFDLYTDPIINAPSAKSPPRGLPSRSSRCPDVPLSELSRIPPSRLRGLIGPSQQELNRLHRFEELERRDFHLY